MTLIRLSLLLFSFCSLTARASSEGFSFFRPIEPVRSIEVMAHQGAQRQTPENSIAAIEYAIADGFEWVEVNLQLTRDGQHILLQDATLDRTTDGVGRASAFNVDELKRLDAGSKFAQRFARTQILTLDEVLKLAKKRINLRLDCKQIEPARLVRSVIDAGMERQVAVFASSKDLQAIRSIPDGQRLALICEWEPAQTALMAELHPAAIDIHAADATQERCRSMHALGIKVEVKTLNKADCPEVWDRVMAAGVDWLLTDRPEEVIARETLRRIGKKPIKIAHHRGANRYAPENTLPALEKSIALGADLVEFDVRTTRDGAFVLLHDGSLNRTTNAKGLIQERTAAEVAGLDAGSGFGRAFANTPIPTLDAFLSAVGDRAELYFDAKAITPEALVATLRAHNAIDRAIVYQGVDYLERLRKIEPRIRRMPPLKSVDDLDLIADRVAPYAFDTRWSLLSQDMIARCHAKGIKVYSDALGFNETIPAYQQAIRNGIDLIQTDHPLRVLRAIELMNVSRTE